MRAVRVLLSAFFVTSFALVLSANSAGSAKDTADRLGSTRAEFDEKYGQAEGSDLPDHAGATLATYREARGYEEIAVVYYRDAAILLTLTPETGTTWELDRAAVLADRFFPRDLVLSSENFDEDRFLTEGEILYRVSSEALAKVVDERTYEEFGADGASGDAVALLEFVEDDAVTAITLSIGVSDPIDFGAAPTGTGSTQSAGQQQEQQQQPQQQQQQQQTGLTAAEQAYLVDILVITSGVADSVLRCGDLATAAGNDIALIFDEDWIIDVAAELAYWRVTRDEVASIVPPPAFADVHALILGAMDKLVEASYEFSYGVDNFDPDALTRAGQLIDEGTVLIIQASVELDRILEERGV